MNGKEETCTNITAFIDGFDNDLILGTDEQD